MKKTLIALAVATSTAVSGSAMAWTAHGSGGSVELGGSLTPVTKMTPWEVEVGSAVTDLNADIQKHQSKVNIQVNKDIPILGIRNADPQGFRGMTGIAPVIDFQNAVNIDGFKNSVTQLTLPVNDPQGNKIGNMSVDFTAAAFTTWRAINGGEGKSYLSSSDPDSAFFGGLPKKAGDTAGTSAYHVVEKILPEAFAHIGTASAPWAAATNERFSDPNVIYTAAYSAGIEEGKTIRLTLDAPAADTQITWQASMPVTVSYL